MTPKQEKKIYNSLNPYQLATLAYESSIECNAAENERIYNVINWTDRHFVSEYRSRLNTLGLLVGMWGIEYWQTTAGIIAYGHVICGSDAVEETETIIDYDRDGMILYHKRTALIAALRTFCAETGLCIDKVLIFLEIDPESFIEQDKMPDKALNDEYVEMFLDALK